MGFCRANALKTGPLFLCYNGLLSFYLIYKFKIFALRLVLGVRIGNIRGPMTCGTSEGGTAIEITNLILKCIRIQRRQPVGVFLFCFFVLFSKQ